MYYIFMYLLCFYEFIYILPLCCYILMYSPELPLVLSSPQFDYLIKYFIVSDLSFFLKSTNKIARCIEKLEFMAGLRP